MARKFNSICISCNNMYIQLGKKLVDSLYQHFTEHYSSEETKKMPLKVLQDMHVLLLLINI